MKKEMLWKTQVKIPFILKMFCLMILNCNQEYFAHNFHSPVFLQSYELEVFINTTNGLTPAC